MTVIARWFTMPQPRSGAGCTDGDCDARRARIDLDAIRARFPDHA